MRLYAAIIQTPPLPVGPQLPQRHSMEYGWAWLARVLNMEPHPTLTATAIGDFLEVRLEISSVTRFIHVHVRQGHPYSSQQQLEFSLLDQHEVYCISYNIENHTYVHVKWPVREAEGLAGSFSGTIIMHSH